MPQDYRELTQEEKEIVINNYAKCTITEEERDVLTKHYLGVNGALHSIKEKYYINYWFEIPINKSKSKIWFAQYLVNNNLVRKIKDV